jgi:hypothetical protein
MTIGENSPGLPPEPEEDPDKISAIDVLRENFREAARRLIEDEAQRKNAKDDNAAQ